MCTPKPNRWQSRGWWWDGDCQKGVQKMSNSLRVRLHIADDVNFCARRHESFVEKRLTSTIYSVYYLLARPLGHTLTTQWVISKSTFFFFSLIIIKRQQNHRPGKVGHPTFECVFQTVCKLEKEAHFWTFGENNATDALCPWSCNLWNIINIQVFPLLRNTPTTQSYLRGNAAEKDPLGPSK